MPAYPAPTGHREPSQVMIGKIMSVRRDECGPMIGSIDDRSLLALDRLLAFVLGLGDRTALPFPQRGTPWHKASAASSSNSAPPGAAA